MYLLYIKYNLISPNYMTTKYMMKKILLKTKY